jgi:DNA-directed RNA polymerase I, II, and III subunit RPABC2
MANKYDEESDSSGGSDSDDNGPKNDYITTTKKIKLPPHLQIGGVGDYDDNSEVEDSDDDDDYLNEEDAEPNVGHLDQEDSAAANVFFDDDEDEGENIDDDDDDDNDNDENYLQKFSSEMRKNVIAEHHPELLIHNYHEIEAMCNIVRNERGIIVDPLHKTLPFVTKYERAKVLGERAKQINAGARPFVVVSDEIIDGYVIALMEFEQKKMPLIIRRPLPNNGCEYWRVADLENLV